jgi:hypothetical protein
MAGSVLKPASSGRTVKKVSFPQPRPNGTMPPRKLTAAQRRAMQLPVTCETCDDGGGGGGGGTGSSPDTSYSAEDGTTSFGYNDQNYAEAYNSSGDLVAQTYTSVDSSGMMTSTDVFPDGTSVTSSASLSQLESTGSTSIGGGDTATVSGNQAQTSSGLQVIGSVTANNGLGVQWSYAQGDIAAMVVYPHSRCMRANLIAGILKAGLLYHNTIGENEICQTDFGGPVVCLWSVFATLGQSNIDFSEIQEWVAEQGC